jgi:pimeloyl-ACP methyl ester carboxylesterase
MTSIAQLKAALPKPSTLPNSFYVHLKKPTLSTVSTARILLVHGFGQNHSAWLPTGKQLHTVLHHEVLIPDLYGHGQSPIYLPKVHDLDVLTLVQQLRKLIVHVGWDQSKVCIAGISMGGALAQLYTALYPSNIERIVLVASGGLSEQWWHPYYPLRKAARIMFDLLAPSTTNTVATTTTAATEAATTTAATTTITATTTHGTPPPPWSILHRALSVLHLVLAVPEYKVPQNIYQVHLSKYPLTLIWGGCDFIHSAQLEKRCRGRDDVNVLLVPWVGHVVCKYLSNLQLEKYPHFWSNEGAVQVGKKQIIRARL